MTREEIIMELEKIRERRYVDCTVQSQHALDIAIEALNNEQQKGCWVGITEYCEHIKAVTGDVFMPSGISDNNYCNQCWESSKEKTNFCPNCGADMTGDGKTMTRKEAIRFLKSINKEDTAICCDGALFALNEHGVKIINMAIGALEAIDNTQNALQHTGRVEKTIGHWITYKDGHRCSECGDGVVGDWYHEDDYYDYCPWCGVEMDGEDK